MAHVNTGQKEITYSSRTPAESRRVTEMQCVRNSIVSLLDKLTPELADSAEAAELRRFVDGEFTTVDDVAQTALFPAVWLERAHRPVIDAAGPRSKALRHSNEFERPEYRQSEED
jgi:hypothetical protein